MFTDQCACVCVSFSAALLLHRYTGDEREYVEAIERNILDRDLGVSWDSVAGLTEAKKYTELFVAFVNRFILHFSVRFTFTGC